MVCLLASPGSLSQVIGFLPADKELREQMLASRSSSSIDLDEDPSKSQVEQDSLTCQCQHVCANSLSLNMMISALNLALARERLQIKGESFECRAFTPRFQDRPSNPQHKNESFIARTTQPFNPGVGAVKKQKAEPSSNQLELP